jgi:putative oxidoreductase
VLRLHGSGCAFAAEAVLERDQQIAQLVTLSLVESGEQLVLGIALRLRCRREPPPSVLGKADQVASAIEWIALPGEEPVGLERVQQRHEDARVDLRRLAELALSHRTFVVEHPEQLELARAELEPGVGVSQTPHRVLAEQREQQSGARTALLAHPGAGVAGKRVLSPCGHGVEYIDPRRRYRALYDVLPSIKLRTSHERRESEMKIGRLLLRLVVGGFFFGHGTQKLRGWFGGHGLDATAQMFEQLGMRPGRRNAIAAGVAEAGGGTALALGFATPLAAAALTSTMLTAINRVHLKNGPWITNGGYEYNAVLIASVLALTEVGPGELSLDHALGNERSGPGWALAALGLGVAGAVGAHVLAGREAPSEVEAAAPSANGEVQPAAESEEPQPQAAS